MKHVTLVLCFIFLAGFLGGCATQSFEPVYINDQGGYYLAETGTSSAYTGAYSMPSPRHMGFSGWWYDPWFYGPPLFTYYSPYQYPYYFFTGYSPSFYHPGYPRCGAVGSTGDRWCWDRRWRNPYLFTIGGTAAPEENGDEESGDGSENEPTPVSPLLLNPRLQNSLDQLAYDREFMQRGRLAYGPGSGGSSLSAASEHPGAEKPASQRVVAGVTKVKIDPRELKAMRVTSAHANQRATFIRLPSNAIVAPSMRYDASSFPSTSSRSVLDSGSRSSSTVGSTRSSRSSRSPRTVPPRFKEQ